MKHKEIWKDVPDYEGYYQISNKGNLKSLDRLLNGAGGSMRTIYGKRLKVKTNNYGYYSYLFSKNCKRKTQTIHRIVAQVFVKNPENKKFVNHKDGDKTNNNDWNLEWVTSKENVIHAMENNLLVGRPGLKHHNVSLAENDILKIRSEYKGRGKGPTLEDLSKTFNIGIAQLSRIINKKRWKHL